MHTSRSTLVLLGCIGPALTATLASTQAQSATSEPPTTYTVNEEGDVTFNVPQSFATLIRPNFNETCSASAGQKRLGKRYGGSLSEHDVACITNSAFGGVTYAASNAALQTDLLLIPTDFQLGGLLVGAADQVATMIRANARRFNNAVFSPLRIPAIAAFFTGVAWSLWVNGPGTAITQVTIPYSEVEDVAVSSSCSSLTYSWTTPTPSTTVVPASPCSPIQTDVFAYEGPNPNLWAAEIQRYKMAVAAPMCWQTTAALWGPTSSVCACAGTSTASALYSTIAETPSQSACAYSATSDLPATIPLTPTPICTAITLSSTPRSTVCGCAPASTASITSSYSTISGAPTQSACAFMASSDLGPPIPEPTNLIDITCWSQPYNKATESCEGTPVGSYYAQDLTANTPCFNVPDCECISATYWGLAIVTWNHLNCYGGSSGKGMTERIGPSCSSHVYGNASMPGTNSWGFWPGCKWYQ